ncbi:FprA family A-type flavoprotein [Spirochaetia bacterium 38H-sp]|uniref:FprA family A-type flavoprotein n=1 Tax=Rarispira pelagica TaxID=3141764 RepID=A0ABU9UAE7_9SPIR
MNAKQLSPGIWHLAANISKDNLFEGLWPIPHGVSLNSYIVEGADIALIDLVREWEDAPKQLETQLKELGLEFNRIKYLILNHLEPDHTGWLANFKKRNPHIEIVTTKKGADLVREFYFIEDNIRVVKTGDKIDLGDGKTLEFYEVPNVHWPETMVTYEPASGTLFSCDAFGSYGSLTEKSCDCELSEKEHEFYEFESLRYYANIVASFSTFVERAIKALSDLEIKTICPSHGIVWTDRPQDIVERYARYASYYKGPCEPEITLIWGSMYDNTAYATDAVRDVLLESGITFHEYRVPEQDISHILAHAWKSQGLILGMPTYEYHMFPPMAHVIDMMGRKHVKGRKVFWYGSFGWSGGAEKELNSLIEQHKLGWDITGKADFRGRPTEEDIEKIKQGVRDFIKTVMESAKK